MTLKKEQEEEINRLTGKYTPSTEFIEEIRKTAGYKDDFKGGLKASQDSSKIQALLKLNVETQDTEVKNIEELLKQIINGYFKQTKENKPIKNNSETKYPKIEITNENGLEYIKELGRYGDVDPNTKNGFYHLININTTLIKQNEQIRQQNNEIIKLLKEILNK